MTEVRPGQVWADNDPRNEGRTLRVDEVGGEVVLCTVLTLSHLVQELVDKGSPWAKDVRGKQRTISLRRFKPTSTGYRLLEDTEGS